MDFKKLTIDDIEEVRPYFLYSLSNNCDNSIGGSVMWADFFDTNFAIYNDTLIFKVKFFDKGECFTIPLGKSIDVGIDFIEDYCEKRCIPMQFITVTDVTIKILEEKYKIEKELVPEWSDYIYDASDLISLSGRKYHGQKNHVNFFKKTYSNYLYEDITDANISDVKEFLDRFQKTESKDSIIYEEELKKVYEVLDNNDKYKFFGLLLKVDGKVVAFSMGEKIKDTLFAHIEKADKSMRGAYPMIMTEFAKRNAFDVRYINREENAGDKGLETSKMQYHPTYILNKYYVKVLGEK